MHDAVVVLDPYGRVVDCNLAAERLIGQPVGHAVGQPLKQLAPGWQTATSSRYLHLGRQPLRRGDHRR